MMWVMTDEESKRRDLRVEELSKSTSDAERIMAILMDLKVGSIGMHEEAARIKAEEISRRRKSSPILSVRLVETVEPRALVCSVPTSRDNNSNVLTRCEVPAVMMLGDVPVCGAHVEPGPWKSFNPSNSDNPCRWIRSFVNANMNVIDVWRHIRTDYFYFSSHISDVVDAERDYSTLEAAQAAADAYLVAIRRPLPRRQVIEVVVDGIAVTSDTKESALDAVAEAFPCLGTAAAFDIAKRIAALELPS